MSDPPLKNATVSHVFITVRDLNVAVHFYSEVLGFSVCHRMEDECAFVELPNSPGLRLALYRQSPNTPVTGVGRLIMIDVTDLRSVASMLRLAGVEVSEIADVPYGRAAQFCDPDGNAIEIHQSSRRKMEEDRTRTPECIYCDFLSEEWWLGWADRWNRSEVRISVGGLGAVRINDTDSGCSVLLTFDDGGTVAVDSASTTAAPEFAATNMVWWSFMSGQITAGDAVRTGAVRFTGALSAIAKYLSAFDLLREGALVQHDR